MCRNFTYEVVVVTHLNNTLAKSVSLMMTLNLADASTEYFKDKDLKKDDVITFMSWVKKQPHLPKINGEYDIKLARNFLKWNEAAKAAIDNFFTIKTHCPEFFRDRNATVKTVKAALDVW
ncbi:hypothetical protein GEV33_004523 [Tenebrio molitor]|uniref:Uncharacterized protein n=1 Tax=Tenebrio molitor TaxID=7067 RepID=A0A8J6HRD3_TENMO|nr:hypothetical protein GEV33_004523 [Tenebrio molitor]